MPHPGGIYEVVDEQLSRLVVEPGNHILHLLHCPGIRATEPPSHRATDWYGDIDSLESRDHRQRAMNMVQHPLTGRSSKRIEKAVATFTRHHDQIRRIVFEESQQIGEHVQTQHAFPERNQSGKRWS